MITIMYIALALVCGFAIGMLRSQREAISDKAALKAAEAQLQAEQKLREQEQCLRQEEQSLREAERQRHEAERQQWAAVSKRAEELQRQADEALKTQAEVLKAEFKAMSADLLKEQGATLRQQQLQSLESMLQPLEKDIVHFRTTFVEGHASLDGYIKALVEQTTSLGRDAENLAKALKGNTKLQGNWGEAVLANLLEVSGLTEGRDFTVQYHQANERGTSNIPDVVVHLPEGRNLIVDSKASLTAYTQYVAATDAVEQDRWLKEHVKSVRKHIKELSEKNYEKLIPGSIGYVLMFIPGEAAYMAAVTAEPTLSAEAYRQHVILINPTNLLMALQLAYNLWQSELQSRSVKEIYQSAEKLYKKFITFSQNFVKLGNTIGQLQRTYDDAKGQLCTGRGNVVSQLEAWKKKGLNPASQLPSELLDAGTAGADI